MNEFDSVTAFARGQAQREIDLAVEMLVGAHAKLGALDAIQKLFQSDLITRPEADLLAMYQLPGKRAGGEQTQHVTASAPFVPVIAGESDDPGDDLPALTITDWLNDTADDDFDDDFDDKDDDDDDAEPNVRRCPWPGCNAVITANAVGCRKHWRKIRAQQ